MEEARFLLVTVHYGTVLGWAFLVLITKLGTLSLGARVDLLALIAKLRYSVPTLVLLVPRKLPTTVIMNTESSPVSPYSTRYPVTLLDYQNQKRTRLNVEINSY